MEDLLHINNRASARTKFVAVPCHYVDDCISIFGNFTNKGETPIMCMPRRSWCKPYITIPEGTYAMVIKHGNLQGLWEPGFHWCMPYTKIQFLVTKQSFQFDVPIRNCPTLDNIHIQIEVSIVMRVREGEENVTNFCYKTSVNQLNGQLDAAISERVRVLARSKTHLEVYNIKGKEHTAEMVNYMNDLFSSKGIEVRSVIITNVKLADSIANELEEKATYASKNTLERKRQFFEIRTINDDQEYLLKEERMKLDRDYEHEKSKKNRAEVNKEHRLVDAETSKMVAEIHEDTNVEVNKVRVKAELEAAEIQGDIKMTKARITAEGSGKAKKVMAEGDCYALKKEAEAAEKAAKMIADEIKIRGRAEAELAKNLASRRKYEIEMAKLSIIRELALNGKLTLFGDHKENLLAQIETFKMVDNK